MTLEEEINEIYRVHFQDRSKEPGSKSWIKTYSVDGEMTTSMISTMISTRTGSPAGMLPKWINATRRVIILLEGRKTEGLTSPYKWIRDLAERL